MGISPPPANNTGGGGAVSSVAGQTGAITDLSAGTVLASGSTTPRSHAARALDRWNAVDNNLVGDGATDNYALLNTLLAKIPAQGGAVWFPVSKVGGTYYFSAACAIPENVLIELDAGVRLSGVAMDCEANAGVPQNGEAIQALMRTSHRNANAWGLHVSMTMLDNAGTVREVYLHSWLVVGSRHHLQRCSRHSNGCKH